MSKNSGCLSRVSGLGFLGTSWVEQDDSGRAPVANWSAPALGVAIAGGSLEPPAPGEDVGTLAAVAVRAGDERQGTV
jgi:hypothetical protein